MKKICERCNGTGSWTNCFDQIFICNCKKKKRKNKNIKTAWMIVNKEFRPEQSLYFGTVYFDKKYTEIKLKEAKSNQLMIIPIKYKYKQ